MRTASDDRSSQALRSRELQGVDPDQTRFGGVLRFLPAMAVLSLVIAAAIVWMVAGVEESRTTQEAWLAAYRCSELMKRGGDAGSAFAILDSTKPKNAPGEPLPRRTTDYFVSVREAEILEEEGRLDESLEILRELLDRFPQYASEIQLVATKPADRLYMADLEKQALEYVVRIEKLFPEFAEQADFSSSKVVYGREVGTETGKGPAEDFVERFPKHPHAVTYLMYLAAVAADEGEIDKSIELGTRALNHPGVSDENRSVIETNLGVSRSQRDNAAAIAQSDGGSEEGRPSELKAGTPGQLLDVLERTDDLNAAGKQVLQHPADLRVSDLEFAKLTYKAGRALIRSGDSDGGVDLGIAAARERPCRDTYAKLETLANDAARHAHGQKSEAYLKAMHWLHINSGSFGGTARFLSNLSHCEEVSGNTTAAMTPLEELIQRFPDSLDTADALMRLAGLHMKVGDDDAATVYLTQVVEGPFSADDKAMASRTLELIAADASPAVSLPPAAEESDRFTIFLMLHVVVFFGIAAFWWWKKRLARRT